MKSLTHVRRMWSQRKHHQKPSQEEVQDQTWGKYSTSLLPDIQPCWFNAKSIVGRLEGLLRIQGCIAFQAQERKWIVSLPRNYRQKERIAKPSLSPFCQGSCHTHPSWAPWIPDASLRWLGKPSRSQIASNKLTPQTHSVLGGQSEDGD